MRCMWFMGDGLFSPPGDYIVISVRSLVTKMLVYLGFEIASNLMIWHKQGSLQFKVFSSPVFLQIQNFFGRLANSVG